MKKLKVLLYHILNSNAWGRNLINKQFNKKYQDSADYWEKWYLNDGTSGSGSYGNLAVYKAQIINPFVKNHHIHSVIEFGCGDGNQLKYFEFPSYIGLDVSETAVNKCIDMFMSDKTKNFFLYEEAARFTDTNLQKTDLSLSLDVIYHLLEDEVYEKYMHHLFAASSRFVIIYAWDEKKHKSLHIRHRKFTPWIAEHFKDWQLKQKIEYTGNLEACDFFVYEKIA
jgi:hypothetical protein